MQKHSSTVSGLHGKMPNTTKPNALEGDKMLLLYREACGTGTYKQICRNRWVKGSSSGWSAKSCGGTSFLAPSLL